MNIEKVSYHKVFNLGNYSNEKIGVDIVLAPGESVLDAFAEAKKHVEKSHQFFTDLPKYERAKQMMKEEKRYTGYELDEAKNVIELFEANYPDYIEKFVPASRQLTEGVDPADTDFEF